MAQTQAGVNGDNTHVYAAVGFTLSRLSLGFSGVFILTILVIRPKLLK